jgi:hypothetical protein
MPFLIFLKEYIFKGPNLNFFTSFQVKCSQISSKNKSSPSLLHICLWFKIVSHYLVYHSPFSQNSAVLKFNTCTTVFSCL